MAESLFFDQPEIFGNGAKPVPRLELFGHRFTDQREFLLLGTAFFGVMAIFGVWLRREADSVAGSSRFATAKPRAPRSA